MKLAFNGACHYPDFEDGFALYKRRAKTDAVVDAKTYRKIVKEFCKKLADRLMDNGSVDLPAGLGILSAVTITRRPQYRGDKFIGYGRMDYSTGNYDGNLKAFGVTYLPKHGKNDNLRCYGFVCNRALFRRVREFSKKFECMWKPLNFKPEMI